MRDRQPDGLLPAEAPDARRNRARRRRVFADAERMKQFMNDGGIAVGSVPAPRTLEIEAAHVDHAAAAFGKREHVMAPAGRGVSAVPKNTIRRYPWGSVPRSRSFAVSPRFRSS